MAEYLNNVFHVRGPSLHACPCFGRFRAVSVGARGFDDGYGNVLFPIKDGSARPIQKLGDAQPQMTIGLLLQFDVQQKSTTEGGEPLLLVWGASIHAGSEPA